MAESNASLSEDYQALITALCEHNSRLTSGKVAWFMPHGISSVADPVEMAKGFFKQDIQRQTEQLFAQGHEGKGNITDLALLSLTSDFISQAERAFLERYKTPVRAKAHDYAATKASTEASGVFNGGFRGLMEDMDKTSKMSR